MPDFVTRVVATPDLINENGTGKLHSGDYRTPLRLAILKLADGRS